MRYDDHNLYEFSYGKWTWLGIYWKIKFWIFWVFFLFFLVVKLVVDVVLPKQQPNQVLPLGLPHIPLLVLAMSIFYWCMCFWSQGPLLLLLWQKGCVKIRVGIISGQFDRPAHLDHSGFGSPKNERVLCSKNYKPQFWL